MVRVYSSLRVECFLGEAPKKVLCAEQDGMINFRDLEEERVIPKFGQ
jgi:hypothetical protein